jgi:hypothetical protein
MKEIVLSYRLLFAQDKASRRLFRSMKVFESSENGMRDDFLARLCGLEGLDIPFVQADRECYRLSRDFPVLRARLAILQQQLLSVKPTSWRAVWKDKRDTVQWHTFWAVIVFGGLGIVLGAIQVILQAIQTFR